MLAPKDPPDRSYSVLPNDKELGSHNDKAEARSKMKALDDAFMRGMHRGADPYIFAMKPPSVNHDAFTFSMGGASVTVTGLEMIQATDPEELGHATGQKLRLAYCASTNAQTVPAGHFDGAPNPPLGLEGPGQGVGMQGADPDWRYQELKLRQQQSQEATLPMRTALMDRLESGVPLGQGVGMQGADAFLITWKPSLSVPIGGRNVTLNLTPEQVKTIAEHMDVANKAPMSELSQAFIAEWTRVLGDPAMHKRFKGRVITECFAELVPEVVAAVMSK